VLIIGSKDSLTELNKSPKSIKCKQFLETLIMKLNLPAVLKNSKKCKPRKLPTFKMIEKN